MPAAGAPSRCHGCSGSFGPPKRVYRTRLSDIGRNSLTPILKEPQSDFVAADKAKIIDNIYEQVTKATIDPSYSVKQRSVSQSAYESPVKQ